MFIDDVWMDVCMSVVCLMYVRSEYKCVDKNICMGCPLQATLWQVHLPGLIDSESNFGRQMQIKNNIERVKKI